MKGWIWTLFLPQCYSRKRFFSKQRSPNHNLIQQCKYLPPEGESVDTSSRKSLSSSSESEDEDQESSGLEKKPSTASSGSQKSRKTPKVRVLRSLSNLGVYTSATQYKSFSNPLSKLFNHVHSFSGRVFQKLLKENALALLEHNSKYLVRIYPFGLRFNSSNEEPALYWRHGAQMVALNWQKFDLGMHENEALFFGTGGMIKKPGYIHGAKKPELNLSVEVLLFSINR